MTAGACFVAVEACEMAARAASWLQQRSKMLLKLAPLKAVAPNHPERTIRRHSVHNTAPYSALQCSALLRTCLGMGSHQCTPEPYPYRGNV